MDVLERRVAITGVGMSQVGRRIGRSPMSLAVEAVLAAIADAGLTVDDIDGIATWPGAGAGPPGYSPVGVHDVKDALRMELDWFASVGESPSQLGALFDAAAAVATGLATNVLVIRTVWESSASRPENRSNVVGQGGARVRGQFAYAAPFGVMAASPLVAMNARRHFHEFGTTREHLGWVATTYRKHAALNPTAIYRTPMTMEDYLGARVISEPLCLYDCDVPMDGSVAVVLSRHAAVSASRHPPIRIEAIGSALHGRPSWIDFDDLTTMSCRDAARMMWSRSELGPADVDVAMLYDGFSFVTLCWLEALGFCQPGEAGGFVEGGQRISLGGELPVNTHGGQLSAGRMHGYGYVHEACTQLWGLAGERQVQPRPEVAVVAVGAGPLGGCMLLTRQ